ALPPNLQRTLRQHRQRAQQLRREEGRWPEFGVALLRVFGKRNPPQLAKLLPMPSQPADFSPALREFITTGPLGRKLTGEEKERLRKAEGKWPDYPRALLELARKHGLVLPGMTLPGPRELWERARAALPDVPERTLFHFAMKELSPKDRERLRLGQAAAHEWLKKEFFKRHPRELRRLEQLDHRPRGSKKWPGQ